MFCFSKVCRSIFGICTKHTTWAFLRTTLARYATYTGLWKILGLARSWKASAHTGCNLALIHLVLQSFANGGVCQSYFHCKCDQSLLYKARYADLNIYIYLNLYLDICIGHTWIVVIDACIIFPCRQAAQQAIVIMTTVIGSVMVRLLNIKLSATLVHLSRV